MKVSTHYYLIFSVILLIKDVNGDESTFIIKFTSNNCRDVNKEFVTNLTCNLKPVRGGMGMLSYHGLLVQNLTDLWAEITFFYKFGTIYRSWLFHVDLDLCAVLIGKPNNIYEELVSYVYKYQRYQKAGTPLKVCPLINDFSTIINKNNMSANALPKQVDRLPSGDYKLTVRPHNRLNQSYLINEIKFQVKSKIGKMTTMLTMG